jgi:putative redox protein
VIEIKYAMIETVNTNWLGDMAFESAIDEHRIIFDADEQFGGKHKGSRPKPAVLGSLAACTGMDVISILNKKKVFPERFSISVTGELTEEHPKYYKKILLEYELTGKDFENNPDLLVKVERAVQLSSENYCGVSAMLKNSCEITHQIVLRNS